MNLRIKLSNEELRQAVAAWLSEHNFPDFPVDKIFFGTDNNKTYAIAEAETDDAGGPYR